MESQANDQPQPVGALPSPQVATDSVEQLNLLFMQVQNLVAAIQTIQATPTPLPAAQPPPAAPPAASQPTVQPAPTLPPTALHPCLAAGAAPPSSKQSQVPRNP